MKIFMVVKEQGHNTTVKISPSDQLYADKERLLSLLSLLTIDPSIQILELEIDKKDLDEDLDLQILHITKISNANIIHCENLAKLLESRQKITAFHKEISIFLGDFITAKNQELALSDGKAQLANLELLNMAQRILLSLNMHALSTAFLKELITERENFKSNLNLRDVSSSLKLWLDEAILKLTALLSDKSEYGDKQKNRRSVHFFGEQGTAISSALKEKSHISFNKSND